MSVLPKDLTITTMCNGNILPLLEPSSHPLAFQRKSTDMIYVTPSYQKLPPPSLQKFNQIPPLP